MENKVIHISSKTQYKEIVSSSKRVIVLFGASWCPACKEAMISYKKYAFRYSKYIKFLYVDIELCKMETEFKAVPVLRSFYKSKITNNLIGVDKDDLRKIIRSSIIKSKKRKITSNKK